MGNIVDELVHDTLSYDMYTAQDSRSMSVTEQVNQLRRLVEEMKEITWSHDRMNKVEQELYESDYKFNLTKKKLNKALDFIYKNNLATGWGEFMEKGE